MGQLTLNISKSRVDNKWIATYCRNDNAFVMLTFNSWQNAYNFCCGTWWYMNGSASDSDKRETIIWVKKLWAGEL